MFRGQTSELESPQTMHHVGYVVRSIEDSAASFARSLGLEWDKQIIHDPLQGVRVSFFRSVSVDNPAIELVEPKSETSPVYRFLERGGGLHHLCFEVDDLESQLRLARLNHDLVVREPLPAVAFGGRRIAWVYTREKLLLEYLERAH